MQKNKLLATTFFTLTLLGLLAMITSVQAAPSADGTTGSIDFDQSSVAAGTTVWVHFKDLESSADYKVNWTTDDTGVSFTTGSNQDDIYVPITFNKPSGVQTNTVYLRGGNVTTGEILDQQDFIITEPEQILNTAAFLAIVIPLLVFAIIVAIYKSVGKGKK